MLFFVVGRAVVVVVVVLVGGYRGERGGCAGGVAVLLLLLSQAAQGGSRYCVKKEFHSWEYVSPNKYHVSLAFVVALLVVAVTVDVVVASSSK